MMKNKTIGITAGVTLAILLGGWHVGSRLYILSKVYRDPQAKHRMAVVPTPLDMVGLLSAGGVTCNVGYAEFVIPSDQSVSIKSSKGIAILGESASLSFAFLSPHDPSANDEMSSFRLSLAKLPAGHPLRKQLASAGSTALDMIAIPMS